MDAPKLLGLCGSLRAESLNRKLMLEAARAFGGVFAEASLRLPLFDADLEARGMEMNISTPEAARARAKARIRAVELWRKNG